MLKICAYILSVLIIFTSCDNISKSLHHAEKEIIQDDINERLYNDLIINTDVFEIIGAPYELIVEQYGYIEACEWYEGQVYKHSNLNYLLSYTDLDHEEMPQEGSKVYAVVCSFSDMFGNYELNLISKDDRFLIEYDVNEYGTYVFKHDNYIVFIDLNEFNTVEENTKVIIKKRDMP